MPRTHCKHGHDLSLTGRKQRDHRRGTLCIVCRECRNAANRALRNLERPKSGMSMPGTPRSQSMRLAWVTRRERYGDNGMTAKALQRIRETRKLPVRPKPGWCVKGLHRMTPENTQVIHTTRDGPVRACVACRLIRDGQRKYAAIERERSSSLLRKLRAEMVAAHPDKGGTAFKFMHAKRRYDEAMAGMA